MTPWFAVPTRSAVIPRESATTLPGGFSAAHDAKGKCAAARFGRASRPSYPVQRLEFLGSPGTQPIQKQTALLQHAALEWSATAVPRSRDPHARPLGEKWRRPWTPLPRARPGGQTISMIFLMHRR